MKDFSTLLNNLLTPRNNLETHRKRVRIAVYLALVISSTSVVLLSPAYVLLISLLSSYRHFSLFPVHNILYVAIQQCISLSWHFSASFYRFLPDSSDFDLT